MTTLKEAIAAAGESAAYAKWLTEWQADAPHVLKRNVALAGALTILRRLDPDVPANVERVQQAVIDDPDGDAILARNEARAILIAIGGGE